MKTKPPILVLYGVVLCGIAWAYTAMSIELSRRGRWMKNIEARLDAIEKNNK